MNSYSCWVRPICLCLMHSVIRCPLLFCGGRSEAQRGRHRVCPACGYVASRPALCARARLPALRRAPSEYFRVRGSWANPLGTPPLSPTPCGARTASWIILPVAPPSRSARSGRSFSHLSHAHLYCFTIPLSPRAHNSSITLRVVPGAQLRLPSSSQHEGLLRSRIYPRHRRRHRHRCGPRK